MKKVNLFYKLRFEAGEQGYSHEDLARAIGCSSSRMSQCMCGKRPFKMTDVYRLCDLLEIPYGEIHLYFPPGGVSAKKEHAAVCGR